MEQSFSERMGFKPVKNVFQKDDMDVELRNSLWNELNHYYWDNFSTNNSSRQRYPSHLSEYPKMKDLVFQIWRHYFKEPTDKIDKNWSDVLKEIKKYFFACNWYEVYDFIEFVANNYSSQYTNKEFISACNKVLQREVSAYRFVGNKIIPITSDQEISEIEKALDISKKFTQHLQRALELLADKQAPDYRNSIKESISAIEAICQLITGNSKATLGDALRQLENKLGKMHPALKEAFSKLYGYTNDAQGIRHALLGDPDLDVEDAKFMLIACSAFINYLVVKADKVGIKLSP
jgi:AbiJ N-terminal domain 4